MNIELTRGEENVLRVALDHMYEHLMNISGEVDIVDRLVDLQSLKNKVEAKVVSQVFKK